MLRFRALRTVRPYLQQNNVSEVQRGCSSILGEKKSQIINPPDIGCWNIFEIIFKTQDSPLLIEGRMLLISQVDGKQIPWTLPKLKSVMNFDELLNPLLFFL